MYKMLQNIGNICAWEILLLLVCLGFVFFWGGMWFCLFVGFLLKDTTMNWVQIWDSLNLVCSTVM